MYNKKKNQNKEQNSKNLAGISLKDTDLINWLRINWVWLAPLAYIYVTLVGMLQSWFQFKLFGIDIFDFSELNDFLLAAFHVPITFIYLVVIFLLVRSLYLFMHVQFQRRNLTILINKNSVIYVVTMILFFTPAKILTDFYKKNGQERKDLLANMPNSNVNAFIKGLAENGKENGWVKDLVLIGTTSKYIFFMEKSTNDVFIAPVSNIVLIRKTKTSI